MWRQNIKKVFPRGPRWAVADHENPVQSAAVVNLAGSPTVVSQSDSTRAAKPSALYEEFERKPGQVVDAQHLCPRVSSS